MLGKNQLLNFKAMAKSKGIGTGTVLTIAALLWFLFGRKKAVPVGGLGADPGKETQPKVNGSVNGGGGKFGGAGASGSW